MVSRLFVLYAQSSLHYTFADETTLLLSGPNIKIDNLIARANSEFKKVTDFYRAHKLALHPEKTKVILFTHNNEVRARACY